MERVTPEVLYDLYLALSNDDQLSFLRLVADASTAEVPFLMSGQLSIPEQARFAEMLTEGVLKQGFPLMLQHALHVAETMPGASRDQQLATLHDLVKQNQEHYDRTIGEREQAKFKAQRERKSDPEIVRRNVEICDLRKQDTTKWTLGRLANRYKISRQNVGLVLNDEARWRRLAQNLSSN